MTLLFFGTFPLLLAKRYCEMLYYVTANSWGSVIRDYLTHVNRAVVLRYEKAYWSNQSTNLFLDVGKQTFYTQILDRHQKFVKSTPK